MHLGRNRITAFVCWGLMASWLAAGLPAEGQTLRLQQVASGLSQPLYATAAPGDANRLFIVEKGGRIRILDLTTGTLNPNPYLTIPVSTNSERGLLGLAFDPDFAANGRFYVNYTKPGTASDPATGDIVVARYMANGAPLTSNTANPTGTPLLTIEHSLNANHNGGWIGFRPNEPRNLYIATGDGGAGNDPPNNAQNLNSLLGKILRVDVSGDAVAIPPSNPFAAGGGRPEIWNVGVRNPWRNSFDRATGDFWIADVGQDAREEINFQPASSTGGENYGWRTKEGTLVTGLNGSGPFPGLTDPIFQYTHSVGSSITGGYVYRGSEIEALQGQYIYGDFVAGRSWTLRYDGTTLTGPVERTSQLDPNGPAAGNFPSLASFAEDARGELYMVSLGGTIYRIVPEPSAGLLAVLGAGAAVLWRARRGQGRGARVRQQGVGIR